VVFFSSKIGVPYVKGVQSQSGGHFSLYVVAQGFSPIMSIIEPRMFHMFCAHDIVTRIFLV
jgi:hypothetical protein